MSNTKPKQLDTKEVAKILGISLSTAYRLARQGVLKQHVKPFGRVRRTYDPAQIEELRQQVQG